MEPPRQVGAHFLDAVRDRDFEALERCLHPRVQMRALHPCSVAVRMGASAVAECFRSWLGGAEEADIVRAESWEVGGRLVLAYRVRLRQGNVATDVEQHLHCSVVDQRLAAIDLLSTDASASRDP
jgi:hypothetical protein